MRSQNARIASGVYPAPPQSRKRRHPRIVPARHVASAPAPAACHWTSRCRSGSARRTLVPGGDETASFSRPFVQRPVCFELQRADRMRESSMASTGRGRSRTSGRSHLSPVRWMMRMHDTVEDGVAQDDFRGSAMSIFAQAAGEDRHDRGQHQPARPRVYRILHATHPRTGDKWSDLSKATTSPMASRTPSRASRIRSARWSSPTTGHSITGCSRNLPVPSKPRQYRIRPAESHLHGPVEARADPARARAAMSRRLG